MSAMTATTTQNTAVMTGTPEMLVKDVTLAIEEEKRPESLVTAETTRT